MAPPYKLTVPRSKDELVDHLGWMILAGPDFSEGLPGRDVEAAFEELRLGLLGTLSDGPKLQVLQAKSRELRKLCDAQDLQGYVRLLEEMSNLLMRSTTLH